MATHRVRGASPRCATLGTHGRTVDLPLRSGQPCGVLQLSPLRTPGPGRRATPDRLRHRCRDTRRSASGPGVACDARAGAVIAGCGRPRSPSATPPPPRRAEPGRAALAPSAKPLVLGLVAAGVVVLVVAIGAFAVRRLTATDKKKAPPGTAANPAAPAFDSLEAVVLQLQGFVERARGLTFKTPVKVTILKDAPFLERLDASASTDVTDLQAQEATLRALRLLPDDVDLAQERKRGLDRVLGFYDPATKELYVKGLGTTPYVRYVLVHELTARPAGPAVRPVPAGRGQQRCGTGRTRGRRRGCATHHAELPLDADGARAGRHRTRGAGAPGRHLQPGLLHELRQLPLRRGHVVERCRARHAWPGRARQRLSHLSEKHGRDHAPRPLPRGRRADRGLSARSRRARRRPGRGGGVSARLSAGA